MNTETTNIKSPLWQRVLLFILLPIMMIYTMIMPFMILNSYELLKSYTAGELIESGVDKYYPTHYSENDGTILYIASWRLQSPVPENYDIDDSFSSQEEFTLEEATLIIAANDPIERRRVWIFDDEQYEEDVIITYMFLSPEIDPYEYVSSQKNKALISIAMWGGGFFLWILSINLLRIWFTSSNVKRTTSSPEYEVCGRQSGEEILSQIKSTEKQGLTVARYALQSLVVPLIILSPPLIVDDLFWGGNLTIDTRIFGLVTVTITFIYGIAKIKLLPLIINLMKKSNNDSYDEKNILKLSSIGFLPIILSFLGFLLYMFS